MTNEELSVAIKQHLREAYPDITVEVRPWAGDPSRLSVRFIEKKFAVLYPMQRYHYLAHLIPKDFFDRNLATTVWFELAPGESDADLRYPDEDLIKSISPDVIRALNRSGVLVALDDVMAPEDETKRGGECHGDFRITKEILKQKGFGTRSGVDEIFDICHVLMGAGGYCDCEVLTNVAESSRLKERYWKKRATEAQPATTGNAGKASLPSAEPEARRP